LIQSKYPTLKQAFLFSALSEILAKAISFLSGSILIALCKRHFDSFPAQRLPANLSNLLKLCLFCGDFATGTPFAGVF